MKNILRILIIIQFSIGSAFPQSVTDYVDLFICTAGDHGQLDPATIVLFGMILVFMPIL